MEKKNKKTGLLTINSHDTVIKSKGQPFKWYKIIFSIIETLYSINPFIL